MKISAVKGRRRSDLFFWLIGFTRTLEMLRRRVWSRRRCLPEIGLEMKNGLYTVLEPLPEQGAPAE